MKRKDSISVPAFEGNDRSLPGRGNGEEPWRRRVVGSIFAPPHDEALDIEDAVAHVRHLAKRYSLQDDPTLLRARILLLRLKLTDIARAGNPADGKSKGDSGKADGNPEACVAVEELSEALDSFFARVAIAADAARSSGDGSHLRGFTPEEAARELDAF